MKMMLSYALLLTSMAATAKDTNISRRSALKRMGAIAATAALAATPLAANAINKTENKKMKVVAINGSSRMQGNTADMLDVVVKQLTDAGHEAEIIALAGETINPCRACFACAGKGNCVWADDRFQEIYKKMTEADCIILGSPTYSADVSSTLKAVIERASVVSDVNPGMFRHKVGAGLAVARRAGAMNALDTLNHFFLNKEMFVVGSTYWPMAYGRLPGDALKDEEGVATMKALGDNIAWLLAKM